MSRFCPLFSSSKGNSTYISCGETSLLIDAGVSYRQLERSMREQDLDIESISAVLITHEHSDHIRGIKSLIKKTGVPVFASKGTIDYLWLNDYIPSNALAIDCDTSFQIEDIVVIPFKTPHDALESLGYKFIMPDSRTIAIATDLGHISDTVRKNLVGCDLVMLESNYDKGMLECSNYPYVLKRRIKSEFGHLSNEDCAHMLSMLAKSGTTRFVLGHLSEQNNMPQLAKQTAQIALDKACLMENIDYTMMVAPPRGFTKTIVF